MYPFKSLSKFAHVCCIYRVHHLVSDMSYIGATTDLASRMTAHKSKLFARKHPNKIFQALYNETGVEGFRVYILEECPLDVEAIFSAEIRWHEHFRDSLISTRSPSRISQSHMTGEKPRRREINLTPKVIRSFLDRIVPGDHDDDCWGWSGTFSGSRPVVGHALSAHVVSWMYHNGVDTVGDLWVLHSCDNDVCCNPRHLRLGTPKENVGDLVSRFRSKNRRHGLNAEVIADMRARYLDGDTLDQLNDRFGFYAGDIVRNLAYYDQDYEDRRRQAGFGSDRRWADNPRATMSWDLVSEIRQLYADGYTVVQIGRMLRLPVYRVRDITTGRKWPETARPA